MTSAATPPRRPVTAAQVLAVEGSAALRRPDHLVTEEPMEIRVHGPGEEPAPLAVTMRTPGHDFELAAGLCFTEGVVHAPGDVAAIAYCLGGRGEQLYNVVTLRARHAVGGTGRARTLTMTSACGVCGTATLDDLERRLPPVAPGPVVRASVLATLVDRLGAAQHVFDATGALHAAGRFTHDGTLVAVREDVGRHNALDKLIGHALLDGALPLASEVLVVSGRVGFELVQKAAAAGIPVVCAVSAPSSLAVQTAARFGQTLVGFLRGECFNVYTHPERVDLGA